MERLARWIWLPIAIPILALFGPALLSDTSFAFRDAGHFYHPLFEWCAGEWASGRIPLWNPQENLGVPALADATSSVFYPGKLLFALPLDSAVLYKLYVVAHVVLAAANSYFLARRWRASRPAAALAAIAYACGGNVVFQYCNVVFLVGAAWLPLAALCAERMLARGSWPAATGLGIVLALMILGGDPQAAIHGLLLAALYAAVLRSPASPAAAQVGKRLALVSLAAVVAMLLAAIQILPSAEATRLSERAVFNRPRSLYEAVAVAARPENALAPPAEPRQEAITRGLLMTPEEGSHHDLVYEFSVGPWRLAEYVWPNVAGRMFPTNRRWLSHLPAEGPTWTPTLYMGLLPLILALSAFKLWGGDARQRWLSWMALVFTLGSFGYYGLGWLLQESGFFRGTENSPGLAPGAFGVYWFFVTFLPTYVYFRYPAKLLPLISLAFTQLAAGQFDRVSENGRSTLPRALLALAMVSAAGACIVWFTGESLLAGLVRSNSLLGPFDSRRAHSDVCLALMHTAIVAIVARAMLLRLASPPASRSKWQLAAVTLTGLEIAIANSWLIATAPADIWQDTSPVAAAIYDGAAKDRNTPVPPRMFRGNLATWRPGSFRTSRSEHRLAEIVHWERATLFPKHHLGQRLALIESFNSMKSADYQSLLNVAKQHGPQQTDKALLPQPTALRLLGAEYLILPDHHQPQFADCIVRAADDWPENTALWKMQRTLRRAWIVHDVETLPPLDASASVREIEARTYDVLFPGGRPRDFSRSAVIESPAAPPIASGASSQTATSLGRCDILHYEPQRVLIEAELQQPGLLVLSDAWYPGWRAAVTTGGHSYEVPIERTNRVLRGVWLPAGNSRVEFRYRPKAFYYGAIISGLSVAALLVAAVMHLSFRSNNSAPA